MQKRTSTPIWTNIRQSRRPIEVNKRIQMIKSTKEKKFIKMEKSPRLVNQIGKKDQQMIGMKDEKRKNENVAEKRKTRTEKPKTNILKNKNRMMRLLQVRQVGHYLLMKVNVRHICRLSIPDDQWYNLE